MQAGYRALREGVAWLALSERGRIRATGEDRIRLVHAMCTNDIEQLRPGRGCYAFFLSAQGRILADANILCLPDSLLIDTEPETRQTLAAHLDKHIIMDDVVLEDTTGETAEIGVEGPKASAALGALGAPLPPAAWSHEPWGERLVVCASATGAPGYSIVLPRADQPELVAQLEAAGAVQAGAEAARAVRLEVGKPRYGEDITERHLPQETQLLHAINFSKGCYIGQEIVERIRSRGGVHRFLVRLEVEGEPPAPGTKITSGEKAVGEITSAAWSPAAGNAVALGYVRLADVAAGEPLSVGDRPAAMRGSGV